MLQSWARGLMPSPGHSVKLHQMRPIATPCRMAASAGEIRTVSSNSMPVTIFCRVCRMAHLRMAGMRHMSIVFCSLLMVSPFGSMPFRSNSP